MRYNMLQSALSYYAHPILFPSYIPATKHIVTAVQNVVPTPIEIICFGRIQMQIFSEWIESFSKWIKIYPSIHTVVI